MIDWSHCCFANHSRFVFSFLRNVLSKILFKVEASLDKSLLLFIRLQMGSFKPEEFLYFCRVLVTYLICSLPDHLTCTSLFTSFHRATGVGLNPILIREASML